MKEAKKGKGERSMEDFKWNELISKQRISEPYIVQDIKNSVMMIVFPMNVHDDSGIDQCEKIL